MGVSKECGDVGLNLVDDLLTHANWAFDAAMAFKPDYDTAEFHLRELKDTVNKMPDNLQEVKVLIDKAEGALPTVRKQEALINLRRGIIDFVFQKVVACELRR